MLTWIVRLEASLPLSSPILGPLHRLRNQLIQEPWIHQLTMGNPQEAWSLLSKGDEKEDEERDKEPTNFLYEKWIGDMARTLLFPSYEHKEEEEEEKEENLRSSNKSLPSLGEKVLSKVQRPSSPCLQESSLIKVELKGGFEGAIERFPRRDGPYGAQSVIGNLACLDVLMTLDEVMLGQREEEERGQGDGMDLGDQLGESMDEKDTSARADQGVREAILDEKEDGMTEARQQGPLPQALHWLLYNWLPSIGSHEGLRIIQTLLPTLPMSILLRMTRYIWTTFPSLPFPFNSSESPSQDLNDQHIDEATLITQAGYQVLKEVMRRRQGKGGEGSQRKSWYLGNEGEVKRCCRWILQVLLRRCTQYANHVQVGIERGW